MKLSMKLSKKANDVYLKICKDSIKLGEIKRFAKEIKKDHELALELWQVPEVHPRLLSVLIMDKKKLDQEFIEKIIFDLDQHDFNKANQIADWFLANQLMKDKKTISLLQTWQNHKMPILRRLFWYYQARLRWTGRASLNNSLDLLIFLEKNLAKEKPTVQWAMNFCAAQIGIHEVKYQSRCIELGESTGLYQEELASTPKGCTPNYLPEFIKIEFNKLKNSLK